MFIDVFFVHQQAREALLQHILRNVFHVRANSDTNEDLVKHLQKSGLLKNERIVKGNYFIERKENTLIFCFNYSCQPHLFESPQLSTDILIFLKTNRATTCKYAPELQH